MSAVVRCKKFFFDYFDEKWYQLNADINKIINKKVEKEKFLEQALQSDFYNKEFKINGF